MPARLCDVLCAASAHEPTQILGIVAGSAGGLLAVDDRRRIVLVIALGLAIAVIVCTSNATIGSTGDGGWLAHAPNTGALVSPELAAGLPGRSSDIVRSGAMWLGGVAVWAALSYWILRQRGCDDV
jgi:hypothetical protein